MKTPKKVQGKEMKQNGKAKGWIETLIVIGLILIIPLFFVTQGRLTITGKSKTRFV